MFGSAGGDGNAFGGDVFRAPTNNNNNTNNMGGFGNANGFNMFGGNNKKLEKKSYNNSKLIYLANRKRNRWKRTNGTNLI